MKKKKLKPSQFELWKSYQDVAMHFNEMILKLRIQALAALVAFSSIIILLREAKTISTVTLFLILIFLLLGWTSIWILDMKYYNRLLEGSVDALLKLEQKKSNQIILSTSIEKAFSKKLNHEKTAWYVDYRNWFYFIFFLALFVFVIVTGLKIWCNCI